MSLLLLVRNPGCMPGCRTMVRTPVQVSPGRSESWLFELDIASYKRPEIPEEPGVQQWEAVTWALRHSPNTSYGLGHSYLRMETSPDMATWRLVGHYGFMGDDADTVVRESAAFFDRYVRATIVVTDREARQSVEFSMDIR